ncbi:MAG: multicopper oxidase domain-containing protein [Pseudohongiellaceae bacterium]|nr:multicopper oxidase domain-containing protein [Pseudohongiellaceae bacterium]
MTINGVNMRALMLLVIGLALLLIVFPYAYLPERMRFELAGIVGTPSPEKRLSVPTPSYEAQEESCPPDLLGYRDAIVIEGVSIAAASTCVGDNPYAIAAFVKGTNNVSQETLTRAGLAVDALHKGRDLDGDGDADEIHIRLEIAELNGGSPDSQEPTAQYQLAPGIAPSLWVFVPKTFGMATENFESNQAMPLLRSPSPSIRIEQGDRVLITLENTHYLEHTIHFHGVDHRYVKANGEGSDGVPLSSELPVKAGQSRTYEIQARNTGTSFYHCHVQTQSHLPMGLQGMFIIEENLPNNTLQSMNIGAGQVRVRSQESVRNYDQEYDMHYSDLDSDLNNIVQQTNDPVAIKRWLHGAYNISEGRSNYFMLNGRSFPYTFRESLINVKENQTVRLRVLNAGSEGISLHTHGHKSTATHYDGVRVPEAAQLTRDVFWLASAQRLDLSLRTVDDGVHSYGPGVWMMHDHRGKGITNGGIAPGGNMTAIVYDDYLRDDGWPITQGKDFGQFFDPRFYQRIDSGKAQALSWLLLLRLMLMGGAFGLIIKGAAHFIRDRG